MNSLFSFYELFTNNIKTEILDIITIIAILCGILVLNSKNPVVSVLFLISLFGCISIYLILLGLHFIGLSYLIVYIGAVSILFLFILMLINIRISELQSNTINSIPLAILILISLIFIIFQTLPYDIAILNNYDNIWNHELYMFLSNKNYLNKSLDIYSNELYFTTSSSWDNNLMEINHVSSIGNILYTSHNIWLIITSFILLLAMIGAIIITIKKNKEISSTVELPFYTWRVMGSNPLFLN